MDVSIVAVSIGPDSDSNLNATITTDSDSNLNFTITTDSDSNLNAIIILKKLCVVANEVIKSGSGIGFTTPFNDPSSITSDIYKFFHNVASDPNKVLLVASDPTTNQPLASLTLTHNALNPRGEAKRHRCSLTCFFVSPHFQSKGLGCLLLSHAESSARQISPLITYITLDARSTQKAALSCYRRSGYTHWGTMPNYATTRQDTIHDGIFLHKRIRDQTLPYTTNFTSHLTKPAVNIFWDPDFPTIDPSKETLVFVHGFPDTRKTWNAMSGENEERMTDNEEANDDNE
ncbi:hypothetical protein TL16_g06364 [Triparma laevis f. inornata]|uniref:N-acetyltransferase domain-containing protein n=1 Tax=Triparma laevis f. inornata TaxID=1714386 RepID=A0A9W7EF07_9STRA|nr:hypothetical protein TL16_g06364 [Triparma laevis f. inornata]